MLVQDNQQVTDSWFAAILDGEGSFRITKHGTPEVRIVNTDLDIIDACEQFLKGNHIVYKKSSQKVRNRKRFFTVGITNDSNQIFQYATMLYNLLEPKLQCRRQQFQRILGTSETLRPLTVDFDWLIGIWEGEGYFSLTKGYRGSADMQIGLGNTNPLILEKVAINLKAIDCPFYIRSKNYERKEWKNAQEIVIRGLHRCYKFLQGTNTKWSAKRNVRLSELCTEFVNSRFMKEAKDEFTLREAQIIQTCIDINNS
jgi:hypothetical protein